MAAQAAEWGATAVGGMTMGADPIACAALAGGADVKAFFVRKETKQHGLSRRIEGPLLEPSDRCMLVEDVVTTGRLDDQGPPGASGRGPRGVRGARHMRSAGRWRRGDREAAGAPYRALTTIDDVYPERPDR